MVDKKKEMQRWILLLVVVALVVSAPALVPGFVVSGHDSGFHWTRIEGIVAGLVSGQFPVRVNPLLLNGYGAPSGIFYPDFFLYPLAFLRIAGLSMEAVWRIFYVGLNLATAFLAWLAFSAYARSQRRGAVAALFYLVFLYRLIDFYARSAVGEMLGMAFLPGALIFPWIVLWRSPRFWPAVVVFTTGILQSHIITSLLVLLVDVGILAISWQRLLRRDVQQALVKSVGFVAILNLWFYAPLLYFHQHMDYVMKGVERSSLVSAVSTLASKDYYMGTMLLVLLAGIVAWMLWRRFFWRRAVRKDAWILLVASIGTILLTAWPTPWRIIGSVAGVLQFTFRLGIFPAVLLSLFFGLMLTDVWRWRTIALCLLVALVGNFYWLLSGSYRCPPHVVPEQNMHFAGIRAMHLNEGKVRWGTHGESDYMDRTVWLALPGSNENRNARLQEDTAAAQAILPKTRIADVMRKENSFRILYSEGAPEKIHLPLFYYMGYRIESSTEKLCLLGKDEDGRICVDLPASAGWVRVWYDGLPWFHATDLLSWFGLFVFLTVALQEYRKCQQCGNKWIRSTKQKKYFEMSC